MGLGFGCFSGGLGHGLRTVAIFSRRPLVWELVTENSGVEVDDEEPWLEDELSESDESDWLQEPDASLTEF